MFDRICLWGCVALGFCLLEDFWSWFWVWCLWLVCSYFLFLPGSVLEGYTFPRIGSISSTLSILLACNLLILFSYDLLYFCVVCCNFSFFIFRFVDLSLPPFVLDGILSFIFSQNQLCNEFCCSLHFFFICFFWSLWFLSF